MLIISISIVLIVSFCIQSTLNCVTHDTNPTWRMKKVAFSKYLGLSRLPTVSKYNTLNVQPMLHNNLVVKVERFKIQQLQNICRKCVVKMERLKADQLVKICKNLNVKVERYKLHQWINICGKSTVKIERLKSNNWWPYAKMYLYYNKWLRHDHLNIEIFSNFIFVSASCVVIS